MPGVPTTRYFPELNVRTYVTVGDKPGVYFFSLDATSRLAVEVARLTFGLRYLKARMHCQANADGWIHYESVRTDRRGPPARLTMRYRPTSEPNIAQTGTLDAFLTERYCLYAATRRGTIRRGEIHHKPWPLQYAEITMEQCDMTRLLELYLAQAPEHVRYADSLDVLAWAPKRVHQSPSRSHHRR
jgi:uncharacterized protein YqjF (DUF2071 family)